MAERGGFIVGNQSRFHVSNRISTFLSAAKSRVLRHKLPVFALSSVVLLGAPVMAHQLNYSSADVSVQSNSNQQSSLPNSGSEENTNSSETSSSSANNASGRPGDTNNSTSGSSQVNIHTQSNGDGSAPQVTINGQSVPVPPNGRVYTSVPQSSNSNNQTIDVQVHNNSSSAANTHNSLNVQVYSNGSASSSSTDTRGADRNIRER